MTNPFINFPIPTALLDTGAVTATGGSTPRSLADRFSDIIIVDDYGADPTGILDSTTAIQNAINYASSKGGGLVTLNKGTYLISNVVFMANGVYLRGQGRGASIIKCTANITASSPIAGIICTKSGVLDLTVNANNLITTQAVVGYFQSSEIVIDNIEVLHLSLIGVSLNGGSDNWITNNYIQKDTPTGATLNEAITVSASGGANSRIHIKNNICINSGTDTNIQYSEIIGNFIVGFAFGAGITMEQDVVNCHDNVICNNVVGNSGTGTDVNITSPEGIENWAPNGVICNNIFFSNSGPGILAGGTNCTYIGNICRDNGNALLGATPGIDAAWASSSFNASGSRFIGNQSFNTNGASGSQTYGYGEFGASPATGIVLVGNNFNTNKTGPTNLQFPTTQVDYPLPQSYTPSLAAGSGTFTSATAAGGYFVLNKTVFFWVTVTITTNGSASSSVIVGLPPGLVPSQAGPSASLQWSVSGKCPNSAFGLAGFFSGGDTTFSFTRSDGGFPGADGFSLNISGSYLTA